MAPKPFYGLNTHGRLHQIPGRIYNPLASPPVRDRRLCRFGCHRGARIGKRKLERIPVNEAQLDQTSRDRAVRTPDLVSMPENSWQTTIEKFKALRGLLEMDEAKRTWAVVTRVAHAIDKHPATIYRWIQQYKNSERLSVLALGELRY
jgi:hypothetical protein